MALSSEDLVGQLPDPFPHRDDGFAHSFDVEQREQIRDFFGKYGYVVVRDVLSPKQVQDSRDELFAKFDSNNEDSVTAFLKCPDNQLSGLGILGVGNDTRSLTQLCNRQNERVYRAFAAVYGDSRLIVDHDRLGAMRPTLQSDGNIKSEWQTVNNWLHIDCNPATGEISIGSMAPPSDGNPHDFDKESPFLVQAVLALSDTREDDGGFVCVPGSHRITKEWAVRNGWHRRPFLGQLRPELEDPLQQRQHCIPLCAGSLVIWNAFTLHANRPNRSDRWRVNQYLRMYPVTQTRFRPLAPNINDYPKDFIENLITPLGRRLFGIDSWEE